MAVTSPAMTGDGVITFSEQVRESDDT
jgi:hypothetical protein